MSEDKHQIKKRIASEDEVKEYINNMCQRLNETLKNLVIPTRIKNEDKTAIFMAKYGLSDEDVCKELLELDIINYSYTDEDHDKDRKEEVWIFGKMMEIEPRYYVEVYIKVILRRKVICLSFHPKEYDLTYPYLN